MQTLPSNMYFELTLQVYIIENPWFHCWNCVVNVKPAFAWIIKFLLIGCKVLVLHDGSSLLFAVRNSCLTWKNLWWIYSQLLWTSAEATTREIWFIRIAGREAFLPLLKISVTFLRNSRHSFFLSQGNNFIVPLNSMG